MYLTMLKSKLHQARVTHTESEYEGSCAIDAELLVAAGIRDHQQIDIYNITNGERLTTYAIRAEGGSGIISMNGAAAHKARPGDRVIICCYALVPEAELEGYQPVLVYCDEQNRISHTRNAIARQVA